MDIERLKGLFHREKKELKPNDLQNKVLTIGAQWKMGGVPWWSIGTMREGIAELDGRFPDPYHLIRGIHKLKKEGGLEEKRGILGYDDKLTPLSEVPVNVDEDKNFFSYFSVTEEGNKMRGRVS